MSRNLLLSIALLAAGTAFAEGDSSYFGVRAGMEVTIPASSANIYTTGAGFHVGGIYHYAAWRNVFIEPGVMFFYNTMSNRNPVEVGDFMFDGVARFYGLRVPLMAGYTFSAGENLQIGVATGPVMNINLSGRQEFDPNFGAPLPVPESTVNLMKHGSRRVDALWGLRLSFTFSQNYYIGIDGEVAFTPLAKFGNGDKKVRVHRNSIAVTLGYNF
ncbi:MAG: outer membrane beta-barrel protein [Muribaculaceae bacterium]|nr:outer membrane beta-barrel protein [Muribaculaceae bacterium]MDE6135162.1 outer membrane beta-barrel protein [Muribaculaceae bacterium]